MAPFFSKKRGKQQAAPTMPAIPPAAAADSDKAKAAAPLLDDQDEQFLERLVSSDDDAEDGPPPPPLPPRPKPPDLTWDSDSDSFHAPGTSEPVAATPATPAPRAKKPSRLARLFRRKGDGPSSSTLTVPPATTTTPAEADREWADLNRMLSRLDVAVAPSASKGESESEPKPKPKEAQSKSAALAASASAEMQSLLRQFLLVLKDIMRGAPTAADDLVALLDGRSDVLRRGFDRLPRSMQGLVTQLPKKVTAALGPEVLAAAAAAAEAQGRDTTTEGGDGGGGLGKLLMPRNLAELVMTPAIVKSMLRAIVNALKVRWPAFVGTNVLWSAAVFLLLFVLWYCHKRGKEERERREKADGEADGVEEVTAEEDAVSAAVVVVEPAAGPRA